MRQVTTAQGTTEDSRRTCLKLCIILAVGFIYILPVANLAMIKVVMAYAYKQFVIPQEGQTGVSLNSRLLPRYKHETIDKTLTPSRPAILWVGTSTQFHVRQSYLENSFQCQISNFYNVSYHSADPDDFNRMLQAHEYLLAPGSTVVLAVYPELFTFESRKLSPSLDHPWNSLSLWVQNLRDGNRSIASLYPLLIKIEWPGAMFGNFPIAHYYSPFVKLIRSGYFDEIVYPDGAVEFVGSETARQERIEDGKVLDVNNIRSLAEREALSPWHGPSFESFHETVTRLTSKKVRVIAFETVLNTNFGYARRHDAKKMSTYIEFMNNLGSGVPGFKYLDHDRTFIEIPDRLWLDESHVSWEGGREIIQHLSQIIPQESICLPRVGRRDAL